MCFWASISLPSGAPSRRRFAQAAVHARLPALRGVFQSGCDRAHSVANAGHAQAAARMEPVRRPGPQRPQQPHGPRRLLPDDVDRPRYCRRRAGLSGAVRTRPRWRLAAPLLVLWFASPVIAWWISRPLARREARLTADQTVFLRKLSRKTWPSSRPSSARKTIGCRRTTTRSIPLPSLPIARRRPTWGLRCWRICPPTTSATSPPGSSSSARRIPSRTMEAWSATGAILQLVRHAVPEAAAAHIYFHGGQRQPCRPSADLAAGPARASRSDDPESAGLRRAQRHAMDSRWTPSAEAPSRSGDVSVRARSTSDRTSEVRRAIPRRPRSRLARLLPRSAGGSPQRAGRWSEPQCWTIVAVRAGCRITSRHGGRAPLPGNAGQLSTN